LERDARQRHQETIGVLEAARAALQGRVDDLQRFERECHGGLRAYLRSQLHDLAGKAGAA
jgi:hypothetical protein